MVLHEFDATMIEDKGYCQRLTGVAFLLPSLRGRYGPYTLGWSPEGQPGRRVFQGPEVTELFGWLNESATVIALHDLGDRPELISVDWGDVIEVEGIGRFTVGRNEIYQDPTIEAVSS